MELVHFGIKMPTFLEWNAKNCQSYSVTWSDKKIGAKNMPELDVKEEYLEVY